MQVSVILLAAGKGQRFQASSPNKAVKQLAKLADKPLILHSLNHLQPLLQHAEINNIYVSLGANKNAIQAALPQNISIIASQQWSQGMGHTLAESVQSIKSQCSHIFIALADHALITSTHYQALLAASKQNPFKIIATKCDEKLMAPAIFPEKYFSSLIKLKGDKGAGQLLKKHAAQVYSLPSAEAKFDVDTLADLAHASQMLIHQPETELTPSH